MFVCAGSLTQFYVHDVDSIADGERDRYRCVILVGNEKLGAEHGVVDELMLFGVTAK